MKRKTKRLYLVSVALILLILFGIAFAYFYQRPQSSVAIGCGYEFDKGTYTDFVGSVSATCEMNLDKSSVLTGGFSTNATTVFYIMNSTEYTQLGSSKAPPVNYLYTTGEVASENVILSLNPGTYYLAFYFGYPATGSSNSTGAVGTTRMNITETFVATPV
jgi:hypothetical protein